MLRTFYLFLFITISRFLLFPLKLKASKYKSVNACMDCYLLFLKLFCNFEKHCLPKVFKINLTKNNINNLF